jgi:hypothetical protein
MMQIVEIQVYGDFDIPVTESVWVSLSDVNIDLNIGSFDNDQDASVVELQLTKLGFKKVKTTTIEIGGNL